LQAIGDELQSLKLEFPDLVQIQNIGNSRQNRPITAVTLFDKRRAPSHLCQPPTVLLTAGEHAREFIPVEVLLALMRNLTKSASTSGDRADILQRVRIIAVPIANPDGRALLEQVGNWCLRGMPNGVDINRNFPWEFGGSGSSADPNNEEYKGPSPLSEPESRALSSMFQASAPAAAYASLHSGSQVIYTPYSDTESKRSRRLPPGSAVAVELAAHMAAQCAGFYTETGVVYEKNDYTADGTVSDWASGAMNVPLVFTFEMFGDPNAGDMENCFEQFNPESSRVSQCVHQQLPALLFLLWHVSHNAELKCQLSKSNYTLQSTASLDGAAPARADVHAHLHQTKDSLSPNMKEHILNGMQTLSRDLHDAQAVLQNARLKLVASLKSRGISS
jgi:hypothetical protein